MKLIIKILLCLALCFGVSLISKAQSISIEGRVVDKATNEGIKFVSIAVVQSGKGTITDSTGFFRLDKIVPGSRVSFSCIGYKEKSIVVNEVGKGLLIQMVHEKYVLNELEVTSGYAQDVLSDKTLWIWDYGFMDNNLLTITYTDHLKLATLTLLNPEMDKLSSLQLPQKPEGLFKDCLGNYHVVCYDSTYQVYNSEEGLQLLAPAGRWSFDTYMLPCVASDSRHLYIEEKTSVFTHNFDTILSHTNHTVKYSYVDRKTKDRKKLVGITDESFIATKRREHDIMRYLYRAGQVSVCAYVLNTKVAFDHILDREIYSPLMVIKDTAYVFDYIHSSVNAYYHGDSVRSVNIDFHNRHDWKPRMLYDALYSYPYAVYEANDKISVCKLDLSNGSVMTRTTLPEVHAQNIQAQGDYIYYVGKNKEGVRRLYRVAVNEL